MKYYRLFDVMSPQGDLYKVDEETGEAWMVLNDGSNPLPAFPLSSAEHGTTQFFELKDYASKYGRLEEAEAP